MTSSLARIDFEALTEVVPAFVTIVMMVFTYNIANGLTAGLVVYPLIKAVAGRVADVKPGAWVLAGVWGGYHIFGVVEWGLWEGRGGGYRLSNHKTAPFWTSGRTKTRVPFSGRPLSSSAWPRKGRNHAFPVSAVGTVTRIPFCVVWTAFCPATRPSKLARKMVRFPPPRAMCFAKLGAAATRALGSGPRALMKPTSADDEGCVSRKSFSSAAR